VSVPTDAARHLSTYVLEPGFHASLYFVIVNQLLKVHLMRHAGYLNFLANHGPKPHRVILGYIIEYLSSKGRFDVKYNFDS
jgi:hypothetical protein